MQKAYIEKKWKYEELVKQMKMLKVETTEIIHIVISSTGLIYTPKWPEENWVEGIRNWKRNQKYAEGCYDQDLYEV